MLSSSLIIFLNRRLVDLDALCLDDITYSCLEADEVLWGECISFCDDRDEIDTCAETLHDFDVKRLESMAGGSDEVQASMDSEIDFVVSTWLLFLQHVRLVLIVKEFNNRLP